MNSDILGNIYLFHRDEFIWCKVSGQWSNIPSLDWVRSRIRTEIKSRDIVHYDDWLPIYIQCGDIYGFKYALGKIRRKVKKRPGVVWHPQYLLDLDRTKSISGCIEHYKEKNIDIDEWEIMRTHNFINNIIGMKYCAYFLPVFVSFLSSWRLPHNQYTGNGECLYKNLYDIIKKNKLLMKYILHNCEEFVKGYVMDKRFDRPDHFDSSTLGIKRTYINHENWTRDGTWQTEYTKGNPDDIIQDLVFETRELIDSPLLYLTPNPYCYEHIHILSFISCDSYKDSYYELIYNLIRMNDKLQYKLNSNTHLDKYHQKIYHYLIEFGHIESLKFLNQRLDIQMDKDMVLDSTKDSLNTNCFEYLRDLGYEISKSLTPLIKDIPENYRDYKVYPSTLVQFIHNKCENIELFKYICDNLKGELNSGGICKHIKLWYKNNDEIKSQYIDIVEKLNPQVEREYSIDFPVYPKEMYNRKYNSKFKDDIYRDCPNCGIHYHAHGDFKLNYSKTGWIEMHGGYYSHFDYSSYVCISRDINNFMKKFGMHLCDECFDYIQNTRKVYYI